MWSVDGIETVVLSDNQVQCISSHLTTFAVLVDHRGLINNLVRMWQNSLDHYPLCNQGTNICKIALNLIELFDTSLKRLCFQALLQL